MSDLFHEEIPESYIREVFDVIKQAPQHTFQILTKRAARMSKVLKTITIPHNAWIGVTVEDRLHGIPRIKYLQEIDARVRFLSVEPLLEDLGVINLQNIHWVIVGGESGPKARKMEPLWAINIKQQCEENKVSFYFKQWGGWGADGVKRAKKLNGRTLDGQIFNEMPEHST
jgi:protein gp37